jgi:hypothetical protein
VPTNPRPDRVIALGAEVGPVFGSQLVVLALSAWTSWFDLTIVGEQRGTWADEPLGPRLGRWSARDDRGNQYAGGAVGSGSGLGLAHIDLTFIPTLAPDATSLTVVFPPSFDGRAVRATLALGPQVGTAT